MNEFIVPDEYSPTGFYGSKLLPGVVEELTPMRLGVSVLEVKVD